MSCDTLILIHSLVRHGNRTLDPLNLYPNDPHKSNTYYPYGYGKITNKGKRTMYETGKAFRKRYDEFLGDLYTSDLIETWATEYERCRLSAQVFLAGLFPPKGILKWDDNLNWQPIPVNYKPSDEDELMVAPLKSKKFLEVYYQNFEDNYAKKFLEDNQDTIAYLEEHSGWKIISTRQVYLLRDCFATQEDLGLELPEWSRAVYPEILSDLAYKEYQVQTSTKELKRITVGSLLKKILCDTQNKIDGNSNRKIHLYIGHDVNIGDMLTVFGVMYKHFPVFGAALTWELHKINDRYGFKLFYKKNKDSDFESMTYRNGETIWWMEDFEAFVNDMWSDDILN